MWKTTHTNRKERNATEKERKQPDRNEMLRNRTQTNRKERNATEKERKQPDRNEMLRNRTHTNRKKRNATETERTQTERNETLRNRMHTNRKKRNATKQNAHKQEETKRYETERKQTERNETLRKQNAHKQHVPANIKRKKISMHATPKINWKIAAATHKFDTKLDVAASKTSSTTFRFCLTCGPQFSQDWSILASARCVITRTVHTI